MWPCENCWTGQRVPSRDADLYAALAQALAGLGVRWYLFGAQAAILHGAVRFTEDVDVTVELAGTTPRMLVRALAAAGFTPRFADDAFVEQTRVIPFIHDATATPLDMVLAGPGLEERFFEGLVEMTIDGVAVPVACASDLVVMKILAGRPKDLDDVVAVVAAQAESFDEARAREFLGLLEQALDQRDLLPLLEEALERARRLRGRARGD